MSIKKNIGEKQNIDNYGEEKNIAGKMFFISWNKLYLPKLAGFFRGSEKNICLFVVMRCLNLMRVLI